MQCLLLTAGIVVFSFAAFSQDTRYPSMDELGWQIVELQEPSDLKDSDVGEIHYLITVTEDGRVRSIQVLSNSFSSRTERLWRRKLAKARFVMLKEKVPGKSRYTGTMVINREMCSRDLEK